MWLKKLKTVSAEVMTSAPSGERGKSAKGAPLACPRPSLLPFPGFIGHSPDYRRPPGFVPN